MQLSAVNKVQRSMLPTTCDSYSGLTTCSVTWKSNRRL